MLKAVNKRLNMLCFGVLQSNGNANEIEEGMKTTWNSIFIRSKVIQVEPW